MQKSRLAAVPPCVPLLLTAAPLTAHAADDARQVAVPAYFYPGDLWTRMSRPGARAGLAVANPANGPGSSAIPAYAQTIQAAEAGDTKVLGYVDSGYLGTTGWKDPGTEDASVAGWLAAAKENVDKWYAWYGPSGLSGIFFDDGLVPCGSAPGRTDWVDAYRSLQAHVKGKDPAATVVINPGAAPESCYTRAADTLVTFEGSYDTYRTWTPPAWAAAAPPSKSWHLVHETATRSRMEGAVMLSKQRRAGHVYVTDDDNTPLPGTPWGNPWDTLPPYWEALVRTVRS
ncbi:spherulation-specific family 4 protein [Streptomyces sp. ODS05-4]|uniref:spherulation-specific family 4 protein n=1 Tax=Streptomyces sp. ODS05-4 TaxID=2944939 RepID=UPI00210B45A4|nr:spherulation-specific family 4 protein [Streptomyces sp. ODS05-4]